MIFEIFGRTETGPVRERNEDHLLLGGWIRNRGWMGLTLADDDEHIAHGGLLLAVADGMGGAAGGQIASRLALESLDQALTRTTPPTGSAAIVAEDLTAAMQQVNNAVRDRQSEDPGLTTMGTTLSALLFTASRYWVLHAGDSRVLRIRNRFLRPLTRDDNLAERLIAQGIDAATAAANPEADALTNWIGAEQMRPAVTAGSAAEAGDCLLLCSDGLYGFVSEDTIVAAFADPQRPLRQSVDALVDGAIAAGSTDNISLIAIRISDLDQRPESAVTGEPA